MKKRFSVILTGMLIIGMLAACGQKETGSSASPATTAPSAAASAAPEATGAANSSHPADFIIHDPNAKIASMSTHITNNLLALGIKPAGTTVGGDVKDFFKHVADRLQGTVKFSADVDMEAVLALKPDYIYVDSGELTGTDEIEKFKKIAPTIGINLDEGTWRDHLKSIAEHVGKEKEAEAFIAQYEVRAENVRGLIEKKLGPDAKIMAIRMTAKELRVMGSRRPIGPLMFEDLKMKPADGVLDIDPKEPFAVISKEVLPDFNADAILVLISKGNEASVNFKELEKNPIWQNLKAVKNKHVYVLETQAWLDYSSLGHEAALKDAEKLFAE